MNTQNNKKLNNNLNESIEKTFKTIDEYINNIQQAELPEDIKKEISTDLKFKKDKIISKLNLVSREEFEVLKKIIEKQDQEIKKLKKIKKARKVK